MLQQNLSRFYKFEVVIQVCDQFNNLINTLKKEEKLDTGEKYPWLVKMDERKYVTDRETLEKIHKFRKYMFNRERKERHYGHAI